MTYQPDFEGLAAMCNAYEKENGITYECIDDELAAFDAFVDSYWCRIKKPAMISENNIIEKHSNGVPQTDLGYYSFEVYQIGNHYIIAEQSWQNAKQGKLLMTKWHRANEYIKDDFLAKMM